VNTDERKCLSSVHPSGVLTGVDQSNAPGNSGKNLIFKIELFFCPGFLLLNQFKNW